LLAHFTEVGAKPYAREGEKESPPGKIRERGDLFFCKELVSRKDRNQQEAQNEFGEFLPQERGLVGDGFCLALTGPVNRIGKDDKSDHCVSCGLSQHSQLSGCVGVKRAGCSCFGGIIDGEAGPKTVGVIAEMEPVADQRESEERECAERKNRRNCE